MTSPRPAGLPFGIAVASAALHDRKRKAAEAVAEHGPESHEAKAADLALAHAALHLQGLIDEARP